jgi:hypothetical protein
MRQRTEVVAPKLLTENTNREEFDNQEFRHINVNDSKHKNDLKWHIKRIEFNNEDYWTRLASIKRSEVDKYGNFGTGRVDLPRSFIMPLNNEDYYGEGAVLYYTKNYYGDINCSCLKIVYGVRFLLQIDDVIIDSEEIQGKLDFSIMMNNNIKGSTREKVLVDKKNGIMVTLDKKKISYCEEYEYYVSVLYTQDKELIHQW